KDFGGQRVGQTKSNEIRSAIAFYVRQIATRMNACSQRVFLRGARTTYSKLVLCPVQSWIRLSGDFKLHGGKIKGWLGNVQRLICDVAQLSNAAVSPISKSAGREFFKRVEIADAAQVSKPAIRQTWKSALRL